MAGLVWSPWIEILAGGLGIIAALWSIGRRRNAKPMHPDARKADMGLLVFRVLLSVIGVIKWREL